MRITIVGGGINGLVAANYLQRAGHSVIILEKKPNCGGACCKAQTIIDGKTYEYALGASVFGLMQDFVFEETGLSKTVKVNIPPKSDMVKFPGMKPCSVNHYSNWGEQGDVEGYFKDLAAVTDSLRHHIRYGKVPYSLEYLGELYTRFVEGSAKSLFEHYFTSELTGMLYSIPVNESGPVDLDEPYSAFNIPLMNCGRRWGFVKEGIWAITENLVNINQKLGVNIICNADITGIIGTLVHCKDKEYNADLIVFATDPCTASRLTGIEIGPKRYEGDSAKTILFFDKPVKLDRFYFVFEGGKYFEIYPEGPCRRQMGWLGNEYISVFYKEGSGINIPELVEPYVGKCVGSVSLSSRDLKEIFYFPDGNIDHMELCNRQTLWSRTFSKTDKFYQFGDNEHYFYCGAGGFPCGSVAGTVGYLCAKEIINASKRLHSRN